jgi:predicted DNA-binding mobile mystery protein A
MGASPTSVLSLERHEKAGNVQLDTLARAAHALDCDLVYALVPRRPLQDIVDARARQRALERLRAVDHTMRLEGQGVTDATLQDQLAEQVSLLRDQPGLWRDE